MSYPYCYLGPTCQLEPFFDNLTMKYTKQNGGSRHVRFLLSEQVLTRWRCLVAFRKAMNLLHRVMCTVLYRRTATTIKTASKVCTFLIDILFAVILAAAGAIQSK